MNIYFGQCTLVAFEVLGKAEEAEIKLATSVGSSKKQEFQNNICFIDCAKVFDLWITTNWKIFKEMGLPDHLTCLLRNMYAGQEATVRTGHRTTDWFQVGKGVRQGRWRRKWQPTPVFLPRESQGWQSLVGFCLWGLTESDTTEVT